MALELQGGVGCFGYPHCAPNLVKNLKIAGNFAYDAYAPYWDSMLYSIPVGNAQNVTMMNNTGVWGGGALQPCGGNVGIEDAEDNSISQGNVLAYPTTCDPSIFKPIFFTSGNLSAGTTLKHQNNILCGGGGPMAGHFGTEGPNNPLTSPPFYNQYNYTAGT